MFAALCGVALGMVCASVLYSSSAWAIFGLFEGKAAEIRGAVIADNILNPSSGGQSTSVVLRLYHLASPTAFSQQDFFGAYQSAPGGLDGDLLDVEEIVALPGKTILIPEHELAPGAAYLGVVVAFRDWNGATWRALIATPSGDMTTIKIDLQASEVKVSPQKRRWWKKLNKRLAGT